MTMKLLWMGRPLRCRDKGLVDWQVTYNAVFRQVGRDPTTTWADSGESIGKLEVILELLAIGVLSK